MMMMDYGEKKEINFYSLEADEEKIAILKVVKTAKLDCTEEALEIIASCNNLLTDDQQNYLATY
jgi:hypothetical protein